MKYKVLGCAVNRPELILITYYLILKIYFLLYQSSHPLYPDRQHALAGE